MPWLCWGIFFFSKNVQVTDRLTSLRRIARQDFNRTTPSPVTITTCLTNLPPDCGAGISYSFSDPPKNAFS